MDQAYLRRILTSRVYEAAVETPLQAAPILSERLGRPTYFKREDLQPIFSFKLRGAYNKVAKLSAEQRAAGVIAASAGNHAQGVAYSAQRLGLRAVIVMPRTTPEIKVEAVRVRGAEVILHGDSYSEAEAHALQIGGEQRLTLVHPYDDPEVIAGQGTIGLELIRQLSPPFTVYAPIGGGGLISGIAVLLKSLDPSISVIGVEPEDSDAMARSLDAGERITLDRVGLFADGVAVSRVGEHTFDLTRRYVDQIVRVSNDEICAAIKDVFDDCRAVMEPAGALAVAGLKRHAAKARTRNLVALTCGANINFDRLRHVAERAEIGEQREAVLAVTIPERPGSFRAFCQALGGRAITEFNYRYAPRESAQVYVGIQLGSRDQRPELVHQLRAAGYAVLDLTENEIAKLHLRHMVGGRAPEARDERVFSFEFPERPGALLEFLAALPQGWNISLFHYRNHGSDSGRVLAGIEVPAGLEEGAAQLLSELGYPFRDESDNPAYQLFLA